MTPADIPYFPETRQIPLSKGLFATVDTENYEWRMQWEWSVVVGRNTCYAARRATKRDEAIGSVRMHRVIMMAPVGMDVDHRNGNGLMNIRENLRVCTESQNCMNGGSRRNSSSKYKGVHWCKTRKKWGAQIMVSGKNNALGFFASEVDAALAYNAVAFQYHGEFARLNIIE